MKNRLTRPCPLAVIILMALFIPSIGSGSEAANTISTQKVLILHSYHDGFTWTDSLSNGIRSVFSEQKPDAELRFEYLDTRFLASSEHLHAMKKSLEIKYNHRKFDVIIACDDHALTFLYDYASSVFPGVPIVFCSVSGYRPEMDYELKLTGIRDSIDVIGTIRLALRLHPKTEEIAVILDKSHTGKALKRKTEKALLQLPDRLRVRYLEDFTVDQLKSKMPDLSKNTVILLFIFGQDKAGRVMPHEQHLKRLRPYCPFPIYSIRHYYLGHGIVGGKLVNGNEEGRMAANMALRILKGEDASDIPLGLSPTKNMFDFTELKHFGIKLETLPQNSIIINRPFSFYTTYKTIIWVVVFSFFILITIIISLALNISRRRKAEKGLVESEEKYRRLVDNADDGIFIAQDGAISFSNSKTTEILGYSGHELASKPFIHFIHPNDRGMVIDRHKRRISGEKGLPNTYTFRIIDKNDMEHIVQLNTVLIDWKERPATLNIMRDITEQQKIERHLQQSQRMEAIGTLAGGIAHDFNNILGAILGYAQLVQLKTMDNPKVQEYINQLCTASERAKELVQRILSFSRQNKSEKRPIDISVVVTEVLKLMRASIPSFIEIKKDIGTNLGIVEADQTQIHQVMMNLCTNAYHAMEKDGGQLNVFLSSVEIKNRNAESYGDIEPGRYIKITVEDTGHGMDDYTAAHIFEPYFTTKEVGKGSGMGLATVHGIIKNHKGDVTVSSQPGVGTSFHIFLPVIEGSTAEKTTKETDVIPTGSEQILFVDDEKYLIDVGKETLEGLGYRVETRTSAYDALEAFQAQPSKYDLIITDMTMPKMNGLKLSEEIMKINPGVPTILCTGFSTMISSESAAGSGVKSILIKPFTINDLAKTVRKVLDNA